MFSRSGKAHPKRALPALSRGAMGIVLLQMSCVFTGMAHDFTYPDELDFKRSSGPATVSPHGPGTVAVCIQEGGAHSRSCYAIPRATSALPGLPLQSYAVELMGARRLPGSSVRRPATPLMVGPTELILADLGIVISLPETKGLRLPLYQGNPIAGEAEGLTVSFDVRTKGLELVFASGRRLWLEAYSWIGLEPPLRSGFPYAQHTFYRAVEKPPKGAGSVVPVPYRLQDLSGALFVYTLTAGARLVREVFPSSADLAGGTLYVPYYHRSKVDFRPLGLCLYPPALLLDVLTGIFQVLIFYEDMRRSCLLK